MTTISTTAIVALMAAAIGLSAAAPAMAQQGMPNANMHRHMHQQNDGPNRHFGNDGPRRMVPVKGGALANLFNFGRDSEQLEIALVRLSHRIELKDAQKPLLESFKTAALAAQADYARAIAGALPGRATPAERPDVTDRLGARIAIEKAHLEALTAVQPSFDAFFASLSHDQRANLMPQRRNGMGGQHGANDQQAWHGQHGHRGPRVRPGQPDEINGNTTPPPAPAISAPLKS